MGALTRELAAVYKKVVSIELDNGLYNSYGDIMDGLANTTLIQGDALKTDIQCICNTYFGGSAFNVCGNLPYYITSKLLLHILESCAPVASLTVMVQKEVAEGWPHPPGHRIRRLQHPYAITAGPSCFSMFPKTDFIPLPMWTPQ